MLKFTVGTILIFSPLARLSSDYSDRSYLGMLHGCHRAGILHEIPLITSGLVGIQPVGLGTDKVSSLLATLSQLTVTL